MNEPQSSALGRLAALISEGGPLRFDRFMHFALYDETYGYYRRNMPGADSDYLTSPSFSPWFGHVMSGYLRSMWKAAGSPDRFTVIEAGPGNAALAVSALDSAADGFADALRWHLVEPFDNIRTTQRNILRSYEDRASWSHKLSEVKVPYGCVLANEVLDNFPVRLFEVAADGVAEVWIDFPGDQPVEVMRSYVEDGLAETVAYAAAHLETGDRFELNPMLRDWCVSARNAIEHGYLVVIDYGDVEPDLWVKRPAGSLVTYFRRQLGTDPLLDVGDRDITAHVDFSELGRATSAAGFTNINIESQRSLLHRIGLDDVLAEIRQRQRAAEAAGDHQRAFASMAEWSRAAALTTRGGLGDLLVLTAGAEAPALDA